ncbi:MAG: TonB-dependent receptor [Cyclobacteriaceae bacterium]
MKQRFTIRGPLTAAWKGMLMCLVFVLTMNDAFSQATVQGQVVDEETGEGLPGVTVLVKGTSTGTVTDIDGNYRVSVQGDDGTLTFSFIGYVQQEVSTAGKTQINIKLALDVKALEEVVVIGYGEQKKKEITGAVVRLEAKDILKNATPDLGTALQGQIAGVNVSASSGQPGAESNIQIRGLSSVTGANAPLFVVDGIPYAGDPKLSNNEIESVDVLKDAASASIYGTRGSGGVILITTKRGREGQMKIGLDSYVGSQVITSGEPLMNPEESIYADFLRLSNNNSNSNFQNSWSVFEANPSLFTNNTELRDIILNDNALIQNHSLNVSGGSKGLTYNVVGTFFQQEGTIINSNYERYNVRANTTLKHRDWTVDTGLGFRIEDRSREPWQFIYTAINYKPTQRLLDPSAAIVQDAGQGNELIALGNLMAKIKQRDEEQGHHFNGYMRLSNDITENLKVTSRLGASFTDNNRQVINPRFIVYDNDGVLLPENANTRSGVMESNDRETSLAWENFATYKKSFGEHNINVTALYSMETYTNAYFFAQRRDLVSNDITVLNGALSDPDAGSGTGFNQDRTTNLIGSLGRVQYDFKGKYLFSASVRRDGSSRFSQKYRWGTFPSVSAGWNVSDEAFWSPLKNAVSIFKVRASYGTTGNQNFQDYSNSATIQLNRDYVFGSDDADGPLVNGAIQEAYANGEVKWETTKQYNFGVDFGLLDNRLTLTADLYRTDKEDMLFPLALPQSTGAGNNGTVILNVGNMTNQGVEVAANYRQVIGDLNFSLGGTFTKNVNEITEMGGPQDVIYIGGSSLRSGGDLTVLAAGYPAGAFFLWETAGVIKTNEELEAYSLINSSTTPKLGDMMYKDQNGDSVINIDDRKFMGHGAPEFEFGINTDFGYKGFDFSMQWYGAIGGEVINGSRQYAYESNRHKDLLHQWSPRNADSDIPTSRSGSINYVGNTDYWLEDASFVRLRNVVLGYTLPGSLTESINISKIRFYVSAQNPLTFTDYTGYDPEVGNNGLSTRGLDRGNYPISAVYRGGIQFEF